MPAASRTLLIATTNAGKVRELRAMLDELFGATRPTDDVQTVEHRPLPASGRDALESRPVRKAAPKTPLTLLSLTDIEPIPAPEETGSTFQENADAKALYYADATGFPTLADDSGLEVDALQGAPGVHSARFAGPDADDRANNAKLVRLLAGVPADRRTARFRCAMALADRGRIVARTSGSIEGRIIDEPRGENGFGYDPHFFVERLGMTAAEMPPEVKNRVSHRGQALAAMMPHLIRWLQIDAE